MKIAIWSVGKADESYIKEGVANFTKRLGQGEGFEALLPAGHGAGLVDVRHAHQIGQLLGPQIAAVFGAAAAAAVEHRVHQVAGVHQHLAPGARHRFAGRGGFGLHTLVNLARHGGTDVKRLAGRSLAQGIGAGGHGLGPKGRLGPAGGHFAAHHAGQIALKIHGVNGLQRGSVDRHLQPAPQPLGPQEWDVPKKITATGQVSIRCVQSINNGGGSRGCLISEVNDMQQRACLRLRGSHLCAPVAPTLSVCRIPCFIDSFFLQIWLFPVTLETI